MAGLKDIAKNVGLAPIVTEDGVKVDAVSLVEAFFEEIVRVCKEGDSVRIKGFGTFKMKMYAGRTLKTPLVEGGEISYGDMLILKFKQSITSKRAVNADEDAGKKGKKGKKGKSADAAKKTKNGADAVPSEEGKKTKKSKRDAKVADAAPVSDADVGKKSKNADAAPSEEGKKKKKAPPKK